VLGLLALPSNRTGRAWWIWAPLVVLALLGAGLGAFADAANNEGLSFSAQAASAAAFGLAAVWLVGAGLARRCRTLSIVSFGLILPYLILSFACSFYRERLKDLLRLPATDSSPPPRASPVATPESPR
jgi:hypothetical protein